MSLLSTFYFEHRDMCIFSVCLEKCQHRHVIFVSFLFYRIYCYVENENKVFQKLCNLSPILV